MLYLKTLPWKLEGYLGFPCTETPRNKLFKESTSLHVYESVVRVLTPEG